MKKLAKRYVSVRIDSDLLELITGTAREQERNRSNYILMAVKAQLRKDGKIGGNNE